MHLRAATHLIEDLQVPAIIGCGFTPITIEVATRVTIPRGSSCCHRCPQGTRTAAWLDDGLVWRTVPPVIFEASAYARLVSELERTTWERLATPVTAPLRLTIATKGDAFGRRFREAIRPDLRLNGGVLRLNDPNIDEFEYTEQVDSPEARAELEAYADPNRPPSAAHRAVRRHERSFSIMLPHVERRWQALAGAATARPFYVFTRGCA